ncbi:hypothetical protein Asp14428_34690 [Actinoplanes sp. NBRC 14428]|nr:hypothetical protein Asp14428_34690 [Actinoplanes sp. NBRC 14428]
MTQDLDTLLTALYVKIDDSIRTPRWRGRPPRLTDSELVCLAVAQVLLGARSEARWIRYARIHLHGLFPYLPQRPGYNKRLRAALPLIKKVIRNLARDSDFWFDNHWIVDSTPIPCGMSRPTVQRSDLAGWAGYGYCASHSRFFWGCDSTWSVPRPECRSCGPWPTRRSANARCWQRCSSTTPPCSPTGPGSC